MRKLLYNSWFRFELSQIRLFRKWHGGKWSQVRIMQAPHITAWVEGNPKPSIANKVKVVKIEKY